MNEIETVTPLTGPPTLTLEQGIALAGLARARWVRASGASTIKP